MYIYIYILYIYIYNYINYVYNIREYGSTLYVGMAPKKNGRPYISIASDTLKSLVIHTDNFKYTHTYSYLVFLWLPTPSRWPRLSLR